MDPGWPDWPAHEVPCLLPDSLARVSSCCSARGGSCAHPGLREQRSGRAACLSIYCLPSFLPSTYLWRDFKEQAYAIGSLQSSQSTGRRGPKEELQPQLGSDGRLGRIHSSLSDLSLFSQCLQLIGRGPPHTGGPISLDVLIRIPVPSKHTFTATSTLAFNWRPGCCGLAKWTQT